MNAKALFVLFLISLPAAAQQRAAAELVRFDDCAELERYLESRAIEQLRQQWTQRERWYRYPFVLRGVGVPAPTAAPSAAEPRAEGAAAAKDGAGPTTYSQTNTQVQGVDEADFVKNDGKRIFVLSQGVLYLAKSWPVEDLRTVGALRIEGQPNEMFLGDDDRLVVFSASLGSRSTTKVTVVDVSRLEQPRVVDEKYLPGHYSSARRVGSAVRVVLTDGEQPWGHWYRGGHGSLEEAIAQVRQRNLSDYLPAATHVVRGERRPLPTKCGEVFRPKGATQYGVVSVVTLDVNDASVFHRTMLLTAPGQVYASARSLYVASAQWWWRWSPRDGERTFVHRFDLTDPTRANYLASGVVRGHLLNQFSMDEDRSGFLRLAVTESRFGRGETTVNKVLVLGRQGARLSVVGETEDLAPGERIYSARFFGDKGYVVTFRQVDPLFTIDLSNPYRPRKVGELKIPGFSTYIHPLDEDHLLTIGVDVPEGSNRRGGVKLSVFDVSDFAAPKEKFVHVIQGSTGSEAQHEHKAFNYFAAKRLLAIPAYGYVNGTYRSELQLFRVHPRFGIREKGSLSMSDMAQSHGHVPPVRRSIVADDFVYAISDSGIRAAEIEAPSDVVATALFTAPSMERVR